MTQDYASSKHRSKRHKYSSSDDDYSLSGSQSRADLGVIPESAQDPGAVSAAAAVVAAGAKEKPQHHSPQLANEVGAIALTAAAAPGALHRDQAPGRDRGGHESPEERRRPAETLIALKIYRLPVSHYFRSGREKVLGEEERRQQRR